MKNLGAIPIALAWLLLSTSYLPAPVQRAGVARNIPSAAVPDYTAGMIVQWKFEAADLALEEADTTFPEDGETITKCVDQSLNGNDTDTTLGFTYSSAEDAGDGDGINTELNINVFTSGTDCSIFAVVKTTDTSWIFHADQNSGSNYAGVAEDASGAGVAANAGTPTYYVNNVEITSPDRNALHDNWSTGSWVVIHIDNLNTSTWTDFTPFGYATGSSYECDVFIKELRFYNTDVSAANRGIIVSKLQSDYGL